MASFLVFFLFGCVVCLVGCFAVCFVCVSCFCLSFAGRASPHLARNSTFGGALIHGTCYSLTY